MNFLLAGILILCAVNLLLAAVANYRAINLLNVINGITADVVLVCREVQDDYDDEEDCDCGHCDCGHCGCGHCGCKSHEGTE